VITVIDENDSPQISPALFYIDESQLSTSNLPVGTMSAFDPDNNVDVSAHQLRLLLLVASSASSHLVCTPLARPCICSIPTGPS